jgi:hypothetical protein
LSEESCNSYHLFQDVDGEPLGGVLPVGPTAATTEVGEDVDGGPLGGAAAGLAMPTTEVAEVVNGRPLGGCCTWVRQRPPPKLEKTLMEGPLGGATGESGSGHHRNWRRHRWWAPWGVLPVGPVGQSQKLKKTSMADPLGVLPVGPVAATTKVGEDIDGGPLGGAPGGSGSGHHRY